MKDVKLGVNDRSKSHFGPAEIPPFFRDLVAVIVIIRFDTYCRTFADENAEKDLRHPLCTRVPLQ